jgi:hypothetical protein
VKTHVHDATKEKDPSLTSPAKFKHGLDSLEPSQFWSSFLETEPTSKKIYAATTNAAIAIQKIIIHYLFQTLANSENGGGGRGKLDT